MRLGGSPSSCFASSEFVSAIEAGRIANRCAMKQLYARRRSPMRSRIVNPAEEWYKPPREVATMRRALLRATLWMIASSTFAACGGGGSAPPMPSPSPTAAPSPTAVPSSFSVPISSSTQTIALPPMNGISGSVAIPGATGSGSTQVFVGASPTAGLPALTQASGSSATALYYASLLVSSPAVYSGAATATFSLPQADIASGTLYYLSIYDSNAPQAGWQQTIGPGSLSGNTLQFTATGATLGARLYGVVLYAVPPPSGTWTFTGKDTTGAALTQNGTLPNIALTNAQYGTVTVQYNFTATTSLASFTCPNTFSLLSGQGTITSFTINRTATSCSYSATDAFGRTQTELVTNTAPLLTPVAGTISGTWSAYESGCSPATPPVQCFGGGAVGSGTFPTVAIPLYGLGVPLTHAAVYLDGSAPLGMISYSVNGTCGQNAGGYIHSPVFPTPAGYLVSLDVTATGPVCTVLVTDIADGVFQNVQIVVQ